jgi:DNA adenine methylase
MSTAGFKRSPMNYIGGKFKLLPQLSPLLPQRSSTFVDLFSGGLDVALNARSSRVRCNDVNRPLIDMYLAMQSAPLAQTLAYVDARIQELSLSKTNEAGYKQLRQLYNTNRDPLDLFVLCAFSFNHQLRFSQSGDFNTPFGRDRSAYNPRIKAGLQDLIQTIQGRNFTFTSVDFRSVPLGRLKEQSFVYADPPYLITTGTYNDGKRGYGGWSAQDDADLFDLLDTLHARGIRFGLSNVTEHKGAVNQPLSQWAQKYHVHHLTMSYSNSNYQSTAAAAVTTEVFVTNSTACPVPAQPLTAGGLVP